MDNNNTAGRPVKGLQPHEVRVVEERTELVDKISKLHTFMSSPIYETLPERTQELLLQQEKAMKEYSDILLERINSFEGKIEYTQKVLTFGEQAVGLTFNPSGDDKVGQAKQLMAKAIDLLEKDHTEKTDSNVVAISWIRNVLRIAAFNTIIAAQMALVKYITWRD